MYRRGSVRESIIEYSLVEKKNKPQGFNINKFIASCGLIAFILFLVAFIIQPTETSEGLEQVRWPYIGIHITEFCRASVSQKEILSFNN